MDKLNFRLGSSPSLQGDLPSVSQDPLTMYEILQLQRQRKHVPKDRNTFDMLLDCLDRDGLSATHRSWGDLPFPTFGDSARPVAKPFTYTSTATDASGKKNCCPEDDDHMWNAYRLWEEESFSDSSDSMTESSVSSDSSDSMTESSVSWDSFSEASLPSGDLVGMDDHKGNKRSGKFRPSLLYTLY